MMRHACLPSGPTAWLALRQTPGVHALWQPLRGHAVASEAHCHAACRAGAAKVPPTEASRLFSSVLDGSGPHPTAHQPHDSHARTQTSRLHSKFVHTGVADGVRVTFGEGGLYNPSTPLHPYTYQNRTSLFPSLAFDAQFDTLVVPCRTAVAVLVPCALRW